MKKLLTILVLLLSMLNGAAYAADSSEPLNKPSPLTVEQAMQLMQDGQPVYSCGMKSSWFSDQPGQCPCCTMSLTKVKNIKDGKAEFEQGSMSMDMQDMDMMEKK